MIVWRGLGFVALLIGAAGGGIGTAIGVGLGESQDHANLGTGLGLIIASVLIWFVGTRMNAPREGFSRSTGQPVTHRNGHTLFWIPVQFWGVIAFVGGVVALVVALAS